MKSFWLNKLWINAFIRPKQVVPVLMGIIELLKRLDCLPATLRCTYRNRQLKVDLACLFFVIIIGHVMLELGSSGMTSHRVQVIAPNLLGHRLNKSLKAILFFHLNPPTKQLKTDFILHNSLKTLKPIWGVLGLPQLSIHSTSLLHIKETWVKELETDIPDDLWTTGLKQIKACSVKARLQPNPV